MRFDFIIGEIAGAFVGALLLYIFTKRRLARREEALRTELDVEQREAKLAQKEAHSELELSFKNKEIDQSRVLSMREDELKVRARDLEREKERLAEQT